VSFKRASIFESEETAGVCRIKNEDFHIQLTTREQPANRDGTDWSVYCPFVSRLLQTSVQDLSSVKPRGGVVDCAVLFADTSGFTRLAQRLAVFSDGAERLCSVLNSFFASLIQIVTDYGGDVVKFAGDAVCVIFPIDESQPEHNFVANSFQVAVARAVQCSLELHEKLDKFLAFEDEGEAIELRLHVGIGCGRLSVVHMGGVLSRWEYVVCGPPIDQVSIAEPAAESNETCISPSAWNYVKDIADGHEVAEEKNAPGYVIVDRIDRVEKPDYQPRPQLQAQTARLLEHYIPPNIVRRLQSHLKTDFAELRRICVLFVKVNNINMLPDENGDMGNAVSIGQRMMLRVQESCYRWEGSVNKVLCDEKGLVIVIGFGIPPMPLHSDDPVRAVGAAQDIFFNIKNLGDGISCNIGVTTGEALCCVVGSDIRREYTIMGNTVNIAARLMSQAEKYGGERGILVCPETRRCCMLEKSRLRDNISVLEFRPPEVPGIGANGRLKLKGLSEPYPVFQLNVAAARTSSVNEAEVEAERLKTKMKEMLPGRDVEIQSLRQIIEKIMDGKSESFPGGTIMITGGRGSGKGEIVQKLESLGHELSLMVFRNEDYIHELTEPSKGGPGQQSPKTCAPLLHKSSFVLMESLLMCYNKLQTNGHKHDFDEEFEKYRLCFGEWNSIMNKLAAAACKKLGKKDHVEWVLDCLAKEKDGFYLPYAGYLNSIFTTNQGQGIRLPVNDDLSVKISSEEKRLKIAEMIVILIQSLAKTQPIMVIIHLQTGTDSQRSFGKEFWIIASQLNQNTHNIIFCISSRLLHESEQSHVKELLQAVEDAGNCLKLMPFTHHRRLEYACRVFSVVTGHQIDEADIPFELGRSISQRAAGNPKHIKELIMTLLKKDAFVQPGIGPTSAVEVVADHKLVLHASQEQLMHIKLPLKMYSAVLAEFETLRPRCQLIIKYASFFAKSHSMVGAMSSLDLPFPPVVLFIAFTRLQSAQAASHVAEELNILCNQGIFYKANQRSRRCLFYSRKMDFAACEFLGFESALLRDEAHVLLTNEEKECLKGITTTQLSKAEEHSARTIQAMWRHYISPKKKRWSRWEDADDPGDFDFT